MVTIDKRRRGRAGKTQGDVTLSTRAAPYFCPALRKRHSARPLCAPQACSAHTRDRATDTRTLPARLFCVSCSVISATVVQPWSASHWGRRRSETRVRARRVRAPVHTVCLTVASVLSFIALLPPASFVAVPRVAKTKTPRSLGDILEDSELNTTLSLFQGVSLCRARSHPVLHETSKSLYGSDLG